MYLLNLREVTQTRFNFCFNLFDLLIVSTKKNEPFVGTHLADICSHLPPRTKFKLNSSSFS